MAGGGRRATARRRGAGRPPATTATTNTRRLGAWALRGPAATGRRGARRGDGSREAADDPAPRRRGRRTADDRTRRRRDDGNAAADDAGDGSPAAGGAEAPPRRRDRRRGRDGDVSPRRSRSPAAAVGAEAPPRRDGDDAVGARLEDALARGLARRDAAAARATAGAAAKAPAVFDGRAIPFVLRRLHAFVTAPAPGGGATVVRCFIERTRSGAHALFPLYKLYADHEDGTGRLLLAARKVPAASPYYAISTAASDAAWNSTSESGYPEKYCADLREPLRHRTDAVAATPPRRRRGAPEI